MNDLSQVDIIRGHRVLLQDVIFIGSDEGKTLYSLRFSLSPITAFIGLRHLFPFHGPFLAMQGSHSSWKT